MSFLDALGKNKVSTNPYDLKNVSHDESSIEGRIPDVVVFPECQEDVKKIVEIALMKNIPLTARGNGTSLEGSSIPLKGGAVVDFTRMNRIVSVQPENMLAVVEPGVIYDKLNEKIRHHGLFFPPSPGGSSDTATIGGMVATNASGIYTVRYGATRDYLLAVEGVTGRGDLFRAGNHCLKSSSGYSLIHLLCGSEGTLALLTSISLRLVPLPQFTEKMACSFREMEDAFGAAIDIAASVADIAAIEFADAAAIDAACRYSGLEPPTDNRLFIEIHSSCEGGLKNAEKMVAEIASSRGGKAISNPRIWEIRRNLTKGIRSANKEMKIARVDASVPAGATADFCGFATKITRESGLSLYSFGHIGTGVMHFLIPVRPAEFDSEGIAELRKRVILKALELRGSVSGEHGIGLGNRDFMEYEHSTLVGYMKEIKSVFDPHNILNPDKIFLL